MEKKKKARLRPSVIIQEILLAIVTLISLIPVYYFVIGAFKDRKQIIKHPMTITTETFTLDNFPTVIKKLKYFESLRNTATITAVALLLLVVCASLAGYAIARLSGRVYKIYYSILVGPDGGAFYRLHHSVDGNVRQAETVQYPLGLYSDSGCLEHPLWRVPVYRLYEGDSQGDRRISLYGRMLDAGCIPSYLPAAVETGDCDLLHPSGCGDME